MDRKVGASSPVCLFTVVLDGEGDRLLFFGSSVRVRTALRDDVDYYSTPRPHNSRYIHTRTIS